MRPPTVENPAYAAFEEYEVVPKLYSSTSQSMTSRGPASKLSGAVGALGAEAIELRNCLFCFG